MNGIIRRIYGIARVSAVAVFFSALLMGAQGCMKNSLMNTSTGSKVKSERIAVELKDKRLVFLGELHTTREHHRLQLRVIKALHEAGVPVAIGLEMFTAESQDSLDWWTAGKIREEDFKKIYSRNWKVSWSQYRDIFLYAKEKDIPLVGLNIPRDLVHKVFKDGVESLTPEQAKELPDNIECDIDPEYKKILQEAMDGFHNHGKNAKEADFNKFCKAQVMWDKAMAANAVEYLEDNPDKTLVVLAGSLHSWRKGIPEQVTRIQEVPYAIILPDDTDTDKRGLTGKDIADYVWVY